MTRHTAVATLTIAALFLAVRTPLLAQPSVPESRDSVVSHARRAKAGTFGAAAKELLAFELMPYSYNRWISKQPTGLTTLHSWSYNLRRGWGWDNDLFPVNHFAHPYSGALFYNTARSHGYGFWSSAPFAFGGSVMWEYFGETSRPSLNDLTNTTLGGITIGETMYRFSSLLLDGQSRGPGRVAREVGAALIDPPRALTRMLHGEIGRPEPRPADERPSMVVSHLELGTQRLDRAVDQQPIRGPKQLLANYSLAYGDPLAGDVKRPFDAFRLEVAFATGVDASISEMRVLGFLATHDVLNARQSNEQFAVAMHYHYNNNRAFVTGGQGFSGGLISRYPIGHHFSIHTETWLTGIVLGAVKPDFGPDPAAIDSGKARSYDYGPGAGARLLGRIDYRGQTLVDATYQPFWYHVVSGVAQSHFYDITSLRVQIPLFSHTALGARQVLYHRLARYATHADTRSADGQTQAFLAVTF